jgi:hypothetical protein
MIDWAPVLSGCASEIAFANAVSRDLKLCMLVDE